MAEKEQIKSIAPDSGANSEVENLRKQLAEAQNKSTELEKKLGEQGDQLGKMENYVRQADTLAVLIQRNPELTEAVRSEYAKATGVVPEGEKPDQQQKKEPTKKEDDDMENEKIRELDAKVTSTERAQRDKIVRDFEDKVGISGLKKEEQDVLRKNIASYVGKWGHDIKNMSLDTLSGALDDAFKAVNVEKLVEDGKLEGAAMYHLNQVGAMGALSGKPSEPEDEDELTEGQKEWADKLKVDTEKVQEAHKNRFEEKDRQVKTEKKG
jgi:hypothetical protein